MFSSVLSSENYAKELKVLRAQLAVLEEERNARKRAEEEIDLLKSLIIGISEVENLNSALAIALKKVCETTGWVIGQAWLPNSEGTYLIASPAYYIKEKTLEIFRLMNKDLKFNPGVGFPGKVWISKRPIWTKDISAEKDVVRNFLRDKVGLKSALGVPILSRNSEVIAVIEFFMSESKEEDVHLVSLISAITTQLSIVIERRKAEDELRKVQERFAGIYNSSKDAIGYCSLDGYLIDVNNSFIKLTGYSKKELLSGKKYQDITPPEYHEAQAAIIKKILDSGEPTEYEKEYIRADGSRVSVQLTAFLVRDKNNVPIGLAAIIKDITEYKKTREALKMLHESLEQKIDERTSDLQAEIAERKQVENALRESEEKYKKLIEVANDAIFIADTETGIIIDANKQAEKLLGLDVKEIIGMHQTKLHPEGEAERYRKIFMEDVQSGTNISDELYVCNKSGEKIPVEISASVMEVNGKKIIQGIFRDLRKWKRVHSR